MAVIHRAANLPPRLLLFVRRSSIRLYHSSFPLYHPSFPLYQPSFPLYHSSFPLYHPLFLLYHPSFPRYQPSFPLYHSLFPQALASVVYGTWCECLPSMISMSCEQKKVDETIFKAPSRSLGLWLPSITSHISHAHIYTYTYAHIHSYTHLHTHTLTHTLRPNRTHSP